MIPELNKEYDYFDDGKIRQNRHYRVKITAVIKYEDIDVDTKSNWNDDVSSCDWLYNTDTDYFIKGIIEDINENLVFVRTIDGGWFSLGWWSGRLDVDGSLMSRLGII